MEYGNIKKILSELHSRYYNSSYELQISPGNIEGAYMELEDIKKLIEQYQKFADLKDKIMEIFE